MSYFWKVSRLSFQIFMPTHTHIEDGYGEGIVLGLVETKYSLFHLEEFPMWVSLITPLQLIFMIKKCVSVCVCNSASQFCCVRLCLPQRLWIKSSLTKEGKFTWRAHTSCSQSLFLSPKSLAISPVYTRGVAEPGRLCPSEDNSWDVRRKSCARD